MKFSAKVDRSYEALEYLYDVGYRRAVFKLGDLHMDYDICDRMADKFSDSGDFTYADLGKILNSAPVFGNNPPSPIYGLTHPGCNCYYMVYPPERPNELNISYSDEQKEEILAHMYPQVVYADHAHIEDIDFGAIVEVTPKRPVYDTDKGSEPWYQEAWNWVKKKIFRASKDGIYRFASDPVFRVGTFTRVVKDFTYTSELGLSLVIPEGSQGISVGFLDLEGQENKVLVYILGYSMTFPIDKGYLISINNLDKDFLSKSSGPRIGESGVFNRESGEGSFGIIVNQKEDGVIKVFFPEESEFEVIRS